MSRWQKEDKRGAPDWLYKLVGAHGVSWWVRYRREGLKIEQKIEGRIDSWVDARKLGQEIIDSARGLKNLGRESPDLVRCESVCHEIVALKKGKSPATYQANEIMARVHVIPYLNAHCQYITELNGSTWDHYKITKRLENPTVALFNHWKFFLNLGKYAKQKGLIKERIVFEFAEEAEDFRKSGLVIPDDHLALMVKHANSIWRDRIIMQRLTGMRPGEVRCLQKSRVSLSPCAIRLKKEDTKTRRKREFAIASPIVIEILERRVNQPGSDFLFPAKGNPRSPMDRCLKGWEGAIARANEELATAGKPLIRTDYTPHDLRHTFLTNEFKKPGAKHALICFKAGLTLEEAQETYLHFEAVDTAGIAEGLARDAEALFGASPLGNNLGSEVMQAEGNTRE